MKISKLSVPGHKELSPIDPAPAEGLELEQSIIISTATRASGADIQKIELGDNKVAELEFEDGTIWICDATSLHDLIPESSLSNRSDDSVSLLEVSRHLNSQRGIIEDVAVKIVRVFIKKAVSNAVGHLAQKLEDQHLKSGVHDGPLQEGLFRLEADFSLLPFDGKASGQPFLLFIHGTNSAAKQAYGDLLGSGTWTSIQAVYGANVLAFQHRTLTESPLQNAVALATALPDGAVLHLVSHSRGGLIGDILCRYTKTDNGGVKGFSESNIATLQHETGRETDLACIAELHRIFSTKNVEITKFVRVASPGSGTKLASRRLEHIFNIIFNLTGGNANPYAAPLKALIAEILKSKDDVTVLPGIEAMNPDSPFIKILNDRSPEAAMKDATLAVIAGNSQGSVSLKGLAAIVLKLFFWQRNDLVVNTDSMYLGAHRSNNIQYFFDHGPVVTHTTYFRNNTTQAALELAIRTAPGTPIPGFKSIPQLDVPGSDRGLDHGDLFSVPPSGKKPIVVLLPGIMGSNLSRSGGKIWIDYWRFIKGGLMDLQDVQDKNMSATSIVRTCYRKLYTQLSFTYDVVAYAFDWRKQLNECAAEFNQKIIEWMQLGQPIKIVGHSMGGVLVRDFIINHTDTWQKLNSSAGFRLLFLGSPLGGSFRIPAVLFGYDSIINSLATIDLRHNKKDLLQMFSRFPGILSLLPLTTEEGKDFAKPETWVKMREAFGDDSWPIPDDAILKEFGAYRDGILKAGSTIDYTNMVYIAGKDKATPCDYYNDTIPPRTELVFLYTGEGDQSVTWESGIPKKLLENKAVYYVNVTHGALANEPSMFDGIEDILESGATGKLSRQPPVVRGEEKKFRMEPVHNFDLSESGVEAAVLGLQKDSDTPPSRMPVNVSVSYGDLRYASYPLLAGHFKNDTILNAEKAIDGHLNKKLSAKNSLDIYPGDIGTSDIFLNSADPEDFRGAIIIGLGEPGNLTGYQLSKTVEQGVASYLLNMNMDKGTNPITEIGISSLIIGCGYGGLSIDDSVKAIIEGVNNANIKVAELLKSDIHTVKHIEIIELYKDRALSCMYSLNKIENYDNKLFNIKLGNKKMKKLFGCKERLPSNTDDAWWNRISIKVRNVRGKLDIPVRSLVFSASTGDAREEERELFSSTALIDLFIDQMSTQNNWNSCSAKTIFELMIPNEIKYRLKRKGNISWILDKEAAYYPWELLQDSSANADPLCVDAGMVRQLSTPNFSISIKRVAKDKALVIGDPMLNGFVNQLPGAEQEAGRVVAAIKQKGYDCNVVIKKEANEIVQSLFCDDYKVIHLAGHGIYSPDSPRESGMVIGDHLFLTTADIAQMSTVPELVFVNCCHLGKVSAVDEKYYESRYKLAANIGTQLIEMGVRAVVVAGWAVDDSAAADFAGKFYEEMLAGYGFGEAVKSARSLIYQKYKAANNTWGAYQCYGDPYYKLIKGGPVRNEAGLEYLMAEEAEIDLNNLISNMDTGSDDVKAILQQLTEISAAINKSGIQNACMAEKEATIYAELGDYKIAVEKFGDLFKMEKADFSAASLEKYCNLKARLCVKEYLADGQDRKKFLAEMDIIINQLQSLLLISPTAERYSLLGGVYKRKAVIADDVHRPEALKAAAYYYALAAQKPDNKDIEYPVTNWYEIETIIRLNEGKQWKDKETVSASKNIAADKKSYELPSRAEAILQLDNLAKAAGGGLDENMDYWTLTTTVDLNLCRLVVSGNTKKQDWSDVLDQYRAIFKKGGTIAKKKAELEHVRALNQLLDKDGALKKNLIRLETELMELASRFMLSGVTN